MNLKTLTTSARSFVRANGPASIRHCSRKRRYSVAAVMLTLMASTGFAAGSGVTVERPWMRFIIKARPAAGYFTLRNDTDAAVELNGASSAACGMLMLHQSQEVNGVDKMLSVKAVTVPSHGVVTFTPGSYHLMCMKPQSAMKVGANVPVTLKFAGGKTIVAQFSVKGPAGK